MVHGIYATSNYLLKIRYIRHFIGIVSVSILRLKGEASVLITLQLPQRKCSISIIVHVYEL